MSRFLILIYGVLSYAVGLGGLTYFFLFVGGWSFLPLHIDSGTPGPVGVALAVNVGLIALFGVQHTIMARPGFKKAWAKVLPRAAERSTFVLISGILMCLICLGWQTLDGTLWHTENRLAQIVLVGLQLFGWGLAVAATFSINHFELFGLRRIYFHFIDKPEPPPEFTEQNLYKIVRHPLQLGFLIGLWSTPTMSMTHLTLSVTMTVYIFIGLYFEEKDLVAILGQDYENYRRRVRMILPIPKGAGGQTQTG